MKLILTFFVIGVIGLSYGQDDQCKNDFKNFMQCMKDSKSVDKDQIKKDFETKSNECFTKNKCDVPDYNQTFGGKGFGGHGQNQLPDSVKQCLKKKLMAKVGSKLNDCLSNHGVKNVNFTDLADGMDGADFGGDGAGKEGFEGFAKHMFGTVKGIDKCCVNVYNKDPSKMKPLEQCLHDLKAAARPKICEKIKPCKEKASAKCQQRGQEIMKALCLCKKEKEKEIAGKLRQLGQQDKVGLQDLVKSVAEGEDIQGIGDTISQCYQENNVEEPPLLKAALAALGKNGGGGLAAKIKIEGRQCIIMADILEIDSNDSKQCDACA